MVSGAASGISSSGSLPLEHAASAASQAWMETTRRRDVLTRARVVHVHTAIDEKPDDIDIRRSHRATQGIGAVPLPDVQLSAFVQKHSQ